MFSIVTFSVLPHVPTECCAVTEKQHLLTNKMRIHLCIKKQYTLIQELKPIHKDAHHATLVIIQMHTKIRCALPHLGCIALAVHLISIVCSHYVWMMCLRYTLELKRNLCQGSLLQGCSSAALQIAQSACGAQSQTQTQPKAIFSAMWVCCFSSLIHSVHIKQMFAHSFMPRRWCCNIKSVTCRIFSVVLLRQMYLFMPKSIYQDFLLSLKCQWLPEIFTVLMFNLVLLINRIFGQWFIQPLTVCACWTLKDQAPAAHRSRRSSLQRTKQASEPSVWVQMANIWPQETGMAHWGRERAISSVLGIRFPLDGKNKNLQGSHS